MKKLWVVLSVMWACLVVSCFSTITNYITTADDFGDWASKINGTMDNVATNASDIDDLTLVVGTNMSDIVVNEGLIASNTSDISDLTLVVGTNTSDISDLALVVGTNTSDIAGNATDIATKVSTNQTGTILINGIEVSEGATYPDYVTVDYFGANSVPYVGHKDYRPHYYLDDGTYTYEVQWIETSSKWFQNIAADAVAAESTSTINSYLPPTTDWAGELSAVTYTAVTQPVVNLAGALVYVAEATNNLSPVNLQTGDGRYTLQSTGITTNHTITAGDILTIVDGQITDIN